MGICFLLPLFSAIPPNTHSQFAKEKVADTVKVLNYFKNFATVAGAR